MQSCAHRLYRSCRAGPIEETAVTVHAEILATGIPGAWPPRGLVLRIPAFGAAFAGGMGASPSSFVANTFCMAVAPQRSPKQFNAHAGQAESARAASRALSSTDL